MLSRLTRRMRHAPLHPARLFALTAGPGRQLPGSVTVVHQELGELALPDGRVVACDPYAAGVALAGRLAPGRYRAQLRVVDLGGRDQRTTAALLWVGDEQPVRWEPAAEARPVRGRRAGEGSGLSVDSATGCLASPSALTALHAAPAEADAGPSGASPMEELVEALGETERPTWSWANVTVTAGSNVIAFTTGYGDGFYPVFWGLGADGEPACLLADLRVLDTRHDPDAGG